MPGGFTGVDVFFVISGFIITLMLLREHATTGTISFRRFYIRRLKRLGPALAVMSTVTVLLSLLFLSPLGPQETAFKTALGATVGVANLRGQPGQPRRPGPRTVLPRGGLRDGPVGRGRAGRRARRRGPLRGWAVRPDPKPVTLAPDGVPPKREHAPDELGLGHAPEAAHVAGLVVLRRTPGRATATFTDLGVLDTIMAVTPETSSLSALPRPLHLLADLHAAVGCRLVEYGESAQVLSWCRAVLDGEAP